MSTFSIKIFALCQHFCQFHELILEINYFLPRFFTQLKQSILHKSKLVTLQIILQQFKYEGFLLHNSISNFPSKFYLQTSFLRNLFYSVLALERFYLNGKSLSPHLSFAYLTY